MNSKRLKWIFFSVLACVLIFIVVAIGLWFFNKSGSDEGKNQLSIKEKAVQGKLKAGMIDPKTGKKIKYWAAPMDPTYIRNEPGKSPMGMDLVPVYEEIGEAKEPTSTIRIDPVTVQNMGVRIAKVEEQPIEKTIRAYGNVTYDETRIYTVNTKFDGWIEKLHVGFEGESVQKGQPLFDIYSPELVTAQEEYLLALRQYHKLAKSSYPQIRTGAIRILRASRKRLQYWDLSKQQIEKIGKTGQVQKAITVFSPASGVVTKKNAFDGHFVKAGEHQYEIVDLSKVWVDVEVYEYELPWIWKWMPAEIELSYLPGKRFFGRVQFIYPYLTAKTRTAKLRLEFDNPAFLLKPDMYANVVLKSRLSGSGLVIPQEAVIDSGVRQIVFVALGKGRFEPREVKIGVEVNGLKYQILEGLSEGEPIVVSAQFMLDSESRLREAVQKMLSVRNGEIKTKKQKDDLNIEEITMESEEDLNMDGLTMESESIPDED
jgi:Cu(I)/Ag(I) efflux system membrane fusion protein/cobalt-zinc-cadmium efflux system membrane fusion protein